MNIRSSEVMELSEKIKKCRIENNLTQEALAYKLGVSRSLIARWEFGDVTPSEHYIEKIESLFSVLLRENKKEKMKVKSRKILIVNNFIMPIYPLVITILYFCKIFHLTISDSLANSIGISPIIYYSYFQIVPSVFIIPFLILIFINVSMFILHIISKTKLIKENAKIKLNITCMIMFVISLLVTIISFFIFNVDAPNYVIPK